jgi:hypothetical protein
VLSMIGKILSIFATGQHLQTKYTNIATVCNSTQSRICQLIRIFNIRCEPFSTYPRTYDLLHADHLFSHYENRGEGCLLEDIMLEMDRIIRPQVIIL